MNKICTSIEQSKKLIELGLDVNTADMFWDTAEPEERRTPIIGSISDYDDMEDWAVPAWSLSALLNMLSEKSHSIDEDGTVNLSSYKNIEWNCGLINTGDLEESTSSNPVDACVKMILKLHELKML